VITAAVLAVGLAAAVGAGATGRSPQTRFSVRNDWPQSGFNARQSRNNPFENVLGPSNVAGLGLAWSHTANSSVTTQPAVAGGAVYVGTAIGTVYALDASTGHKLWSRSPQYAIEFDSSPAVAHGVVYIGSGYTQNAMYALRASTGKRLWTFFFRSFYTGEYVSDPTVEGGVVYVVFTGTNTVYALDAATGHKRWSFHFPNHGAEYPSDPAVAGGVVYIGAEDTLYALRASTGGKLWTRKIGASNPSVAVVRGVVYVVAGRTVYALRASTGHKLWTYHTGDALNSSPPAVANGVVYVVGGRTVYALRASTGHKLWTYHTGGALNSSPPAVANGVVYIGTRGEIHGSKEYALDASTGHKLWSYNIGGVFTSPAAVANGHVYVEDGNVDAFDLAANANQARARPTASRLKPNRSLRPSH
jgi:outer membrane protein assembly factor BamB